MSRPPFAFREMRATAATRLRERAPRAARWPRFLGLRGKVGAVLDKLRVVVLGCGSVGGRIAVHLARLQPMGLSLVDPKSFRKTSLLTTDVGSAAVGKPKVAVTGRRCKDISPTTIIRVFPGALQDIPLGDLVGVDLLFLARDNLLAEVVAGQLARRLGRPLIQAAVHGESLVAQVRTYGNRGADSPCLACGYSSAEWRQLQEQTQFSCEGPTQGGFGEGGPSTVSVSSLCSTAADLALNQALRLLLGLGKPVEDTVVEYCGYTNRMITSPLQFNPACPCDHQLCGRATTNQPLAECSLAALSALLGLPPAGAPVSFTVADLIWVEAGACDCVRPALVRRFVRPGQKLRRRCGECRAVVQPSPFYTHRPVAASLLGDALARPLHQLGATTVPWVHVQSGEQELIIHPPMPF